jgi:ABC-type antimicrobial peptide transport system permease subunit
VARRTREIGIRIALGAGRTEIVRRVSRPALAIAGAGLGIGVTSSLVLMRGLRAQLWGITPSDPATLAAAMVVMLGVCVLACFVPARRAAAVNAPLALRAE